MGVSALLSIGTRAMAASYAQLQTTGHNISNANTAGYSRQTVQVQTAGGMYTGAGFFGRGVDTTTVTRAHSDYLVKESLAATSVAAADDARSTQLTQLEAAFPTDESGLGYNAGQMFNAFADVASSPQDSSARQVVLARAGDLATQFKSAQGQIDSQQADVTAQLKANVKTVNGLAQTIAKLNDQIAGYAATGQAPNDLLDQRDQTIQQLSQYVGVTTVASDHSQLNVFIGGGQQLVLGANAQTLTTVADKYDPNVLTVGIQEGPDNRPLASSMLSGGAIAGLLKFQETDLADARNMLGQMAAGIAGAVNKQQSLGVDLTGNTGGPVFSVGNPQVLAAGTNTGNASVSLNISDSSQLKASDYQLDYDGTNYTLSRRNSTDAPVSITPAQLASGYSANGITVKITGGTPATGDSFLLRPVGVAAASMGVTLADPKGIAAASPVVATTPTTNAGTMKVGALAVQSTLTSPAQAVQVKFSAAPGGGFTYAMSTDGGATYGASNALTTGQAIVYPAAPATAQWSLSITGTPANGDTVNVAGASFSSANNGNANAMLNLRDMAIVGGNTVTDAYADTITNIGVRVQSAKTAATSSATMASDAQTAVSSDSGVNLDEEAARLMQYQQSYQAAAKMLQVAQSLFQTLLQTAGGG